MNNSNRPHSRKKTVGTGSASFGGKGRKVNAGSSSPIGGGQRREKRPSGYSTGSQSTGATRASSGSGLSLKKILIIAVVVILLVVLLEKCGGTGLLSGLMGGGSSSLGFTGLNSSYNGDNTQTSYKKPDYSVADYARDKYYVPSSKGDDTVNVMVYMCGTDLESKYGMASKDIVEMAKAKLSDNVNVIIETGGCSSWQTKGISSSVNQIYRVQNGSLKPLEKSFNKKAMTDPSNLTDFIKYCKDYCDADRNILIFWDHGGGSISGYGYDETKSSSSSMTLAKINTALSDANVKFDIIGFDACLMATLENALVCENYADYLVASEEVEPGTGWYYTNWLTELSENPSIKTVDLAQTIIDDFVSANSSSSTGVTLSVIDLAELDGKTFAESFNDFATSTTNLVKSDDYKVVSDARAGVRQFSAQNRINQVDLVDLSKRIGTDEAEDFADILTNAVKYNRSTITSSYGVSIYFPYETTSSVKSATASYNEIGLDKAYSDCIKSFASLEFGGQIAGAASQTQSSAVGGDLLGSLLGSLTGGGSSTSPIDFLAGSFLGGGSSQTSSAGFGLDASTIINLLGSFKGRSMPEEYDWVDTDLIADNAEYIAGCYLDPSHITPSVEGKNKVLSLTEEEWSLIQTVELNIYVKDDDGYIDLGLDNTFEYDDDNNIILKADGTWLTLNGNLCAYYLVSNTEQDDGSFVTVGRIPALLNDRLVNLDVVFDEVKCPEGKVVGATPMYEDETDVLAKGNVEIKAGDTIELICDHYNFDGSFDSSYTLGKQFKVPASGLKLENLKIDAVFDATYRITDIYDNHYWVDVD